MAAEDPLSKEVSLRATVDQSGLTVAGKSRFLAALDVILGAAVDIPGGWLDGISKRNRQRSEHRARMVDKAAAAIEADDKYLALEVAQLLGTSARKFENLLSVAGHAGEAVLALPAPAEPTASNDGQEQYADNIPLDWLNRFQGYAEDASSERMREMWGRVLAGEARRPGTFSLGTLRAFAEMDQEVAETFQLVATDRIGTYIPLPEEIRGADIVRLTFLEDVGLLNGPTGHFTMSPKARDDGYTYVYQGSFALRARHLEGIKIAILTRIGREILSILPDNDAFAALKRLYDLNRTGLYDCAIGSIDKYSKSPFETFVEIEKLTC